MSNLKKIPCAFLLGIILVFLAGCQSSTHSTSCTSPSGNLAADIAETSADEENASLAVHFLDVGQGNAVLAISDEHAMLIDSGPADAASYVVGYLKGQGVECLDYLLISHYDADHVGGAAEILTAFEVNTVLNPDYETDTRTYQSYIEARDENGCEIIVPSQGETYNLGNSTFTVVAPISYDYQDSNNNSIGIRLSCGASDFLLLGDAELESEYDFVDSNVEIEAEVYMVSHHGSTSSSSERLLEAADPEAVVISAGTGNSYGHPAEDTMERLEELKVDLYRTDLQGTIVAVSDGNTIQFEQEVCSDWSPGNPEMENSGEKTAGAVSLPSGEGIYSYIGNRNSKVLHSSNCGTLPLEKNRIYFSSREEALEAGYSPHKQCDP